MDPLERWEAERMLEEALTRGLRRRARKQREEERKRPYRELAAELRQRAAELGMSLDNVESGQLPSENA